MCNPMNVLMKCAPIFEAHLLSHCLGPVNMSGPDITPISPLSVSDVYRLLATEQLTAIHAIKRLGETLGPDAGIQSILDGFRRRYEETEAAYEAVMLSEFEATSLAIVQEHQRQQQQMKTARPPPMSCLLLWGAWLLSRRQKCCHRIS